MDDDLETGFYVAVGTAAVAGAAAGGVAAAGYGSLTVGQAVTAAAPVVGTELVDTAVEEVASAALGVPVIIPVSPVDLVQDFGKLGTRRALKEVTGSINCFAAGTLVKMDDTIAAKDESTASDWAIAAASVPIALIGYSLSRRRRRKRDEHADVDDYFSEFSGQFVTDHDAITALVPRLETRR